MSWTSLAGRTQGMGEFNKAKCPGSSVSQWKILSSYLPHITWIHFIEGNFYDSLYAICLCMIVIIIIIFIEETFS